MRPAPEATSKIHGITDDIAARCGVSPECATDIFAGIADVATTAVAHNAPFDCFLLDVLFQRRWRPLLLQAADFKVITRKPSTMNRIGVTILKDEIPDPFVID